jgi:hypothetical protein
MSLINGWYIVYMLMIILNSIMCIKHGFGPNTWQNWAWFGIVVMSFIAGRGYSNGG